MTTSKRRTKRTVRAPNDPVGSLLPAERRTATTPTIDGKDDGQREKARRVIALRMTQREIAFDDANPHQCRMLLLLERMHLGQTGESSKAEGDAESLTFLREVFPDAHLDDLRALISGVSNA